MIEKMISVVIPTYHRTDLLAQCLDCLDTNVQCFSSNQYEVIVTDDGIKSTAQEMILHQYPWVKWIPGPRKGPAANRNNGARYAKGEFIAFTDDDCLPCPSWLSAFATAIATDIHVYEGKTTCEAGIHSPLEQAPINLTGGWLWSCNMLIRKRVFNEIGGFNEHYPYPFMEDQDLRERLWKANFMFPFVENAVVDHPPRRIHSGLKLGRMWESYVYYQRTVKLQKYFKITLFKELLLQRYRAIKAYPFSWDTLGAIASLAAELLIVVLYLEIWNRKYPVTLNSR